MMQPRIARSAARPSHRSRRLAFEALDARLALSIAPMAAHSDAHQHPEQRPPETFVAASWAGPVAPVATAVSAGGDLGGWSAPRQESVAPRFDSFLGLAIRDHGWQTINAAPLVSIDLTPPSGWGMNGGWIDAYSPIAPLAGFLVITVVTVPDYSWLPPKGPTAVNSALADRPAVDKMAGALASLAADRPAPMPSAADTWGTLLRGLLDASAGSPAGRPSNGVVDIVSRPPAVSAALAAPIRGWEAESRSDANTAPGSAGAITPQAPTNPDEGGLIELAPPAKLPTTPSRGATGAGKNNSPKRGQAQDDAFDAVWDEEWSPWDAVLDDSPGKRNAAAESDDAELARQFASSEGGMIELERTLPEAALPREGPVVLPVLVDRGMVEIEAVLAVVQAFDLAGDPAGGEQTGAQQAEAPGDSSSAVPAAALPAASEQSAVDESAQPTPLRGMCWLAAAPLVWRQVVRRSSKKPIGDIERA